MTLTVDLTPEEMRRVEEAAARGVDIRAIIKGIIAGLPPAPATAAEEDPTLALFNRWAEEDATDDPEAIRAAEAELDEFKRALNQNRAATGERLLFP